MKRIILSLLIIFCIIFLPLIGQAAEFLKNLQFYGSLSLDYRSLSPQEPGFETHVQHELFLTDIFFGLDGKINKEFPYKLEFQVPTASQGRLDLYQFFVEFSDGNHWKAVLGKSLVPFGYYNELYRGEQFLSVTRPLLYASPDSLDVVLRQNSPHPPMTAGYTDIGFRVSYYPNSDKRWLPSEITGYAVNGFGEVSNRSRTFPYTGNLNVPPTGIIGVSRDWGHVNNNLADNNNDKAFGTRLAYALGDLKIPFPINEGLELQGIRLGFSETQGFYNLEEAIKGQSYKIFGTDFEFQSGDFRFNGEYVYGQEEFLQAEADISGNVNFSQNTDKLPSRKEVNKGYYLQLSFPVLNKPRWGEKVLGFLAVNRLERCGPRLTTSSNSDPLTKISVEAFSFGNGSIHTVIDKYTGGLNYRINKNFIIKGEYSYWDIKVPDVYGLIQKPVSQPALSFVFNF